MESLLSSVTCSQILKDVHESSKNPICFDSTLGIVEASLALASNGISSAPVYDEAEGGFVGMFDFRDLLSFILKLFPTESTSSSQFDNMELADLVKSALAGNSNVRLKHVTNLSKRNPLVTIDASYSVLEAIRLLNSRQVYRLVVYQIVNGASSFVSVLSQSTVNAFITKHFSTLTQAREYGEWELGKKTVLELGLLSEKQLFSISPESTVLDAITLMNEKNISSVPIAESRSNVLTLTGSISLSDIEQVLAIKGGFKRLFQNVQQFFSEVRVVQGVERGGNERVPLFVIHPSTPLICAMEKMTATKAHRVWVVEGMSKLVGVVSLTDVIRLVQ